jgi:hypothetical protein
VEDHEHGSRDGSRCAWYSNDRRGRVWSRLSSARTAVGAGRVPPQDLRAGKSTSTMGLRRAGTTYHVGSCDLKFIGAHISLAVILTKDDFAGSLLTCPHTKSEQEVSKYKAWSMTRCKPGATKSTLALAASSNPSRTPRAKQEVLARKIRFLAHGTL